ncbi:lipoate--protein ligase [Sebaldella sp. S0638]|uniref:lipoate--protein ligase n=1 Tax=Sebaldella sp. S0638 TaxID=2957809 RepID=UPI00209D1737|nr:lipoate--protein ligase [Sebaldella sp. S0638]MCP1226599.1 lipoate--protein ligase [Sebaldella sp. S0638]
MKYIINENKNPKYNLALEEYVFKNLEGEYFFLWQNEPTIVIGKHQNTISEINLDYVEQKGIHVVRRMSGGGAVYHDLGNINFSFIQDKKDLSDFDFSFFTRPIVDLLGELGIKAEFNSRNDLAIDGKKFSGNAQYIHKKKILHHGTLLFNSEMEELVNSLKVSKDKIESKGLKSIKSRVANIKDYISGESKIKEVSDFKNALFDHMKNRMDEFEEYVLTEKDKNEIEKLKKEKYDKWEWTYAESPESDIHRQRKYDAGKVESYIKLKDGLIENIKLYGDFFSSREIEDLEKGLKGKKYMKGEIKKYLETVNIGEYFSGFSSEEILDVII